MFGKVVFACWMLFCLGSPAFGVEAARCSWDPNCVCVSWYFDQGAEIEVRCPDPGSASGWVESAGNGSPDIVDPDGSFRGNGRLTGSRPNGLPVSGDRKAMVERAKQKAIDKLRGLPECAALFGNSPLPLAGETIINMMDVRDGESVQQFNRCSEPDGPAGYYENPGSHVLRIYVCEGFDHFSPEGASTFLIHEALHVAGQGEDQTWQAGPGNYPNSVGITLAVSDACNLSALKK